MGLINYLKFLISINRYKASQVALSRYKPPQPTKPLLEIAVFLLSNDLISSILTVFESAIVEVNLDELTTTAAPHDKTMPIVLLLI